MARAKKAKDNGVSVAPKQVYLTKTQRLMLNLLADGAPHTRQELHACLWDEDGSITNIRAHISNVRKLLRPIGEDIICMHFGYPVRPHYRWIVIKNEASAREFVESMRKRRTAVSESK